LQLRLILATWIANQNAQELVRMAAWVVDKTYVGVILCRVGAAFMMKHRHAFPDD
jgi:hypothetical protein